jgi:nucleoside-diphosphate-sugar epimerase
MSQSLVLGGAGFLGSHLCERLVEIGHQVVVVDDLSSGKILNIQDGISNGLITFIKQDICDSIELSGKFDFVFNLMHSRIFQLEGLCLPMSPPSSTQTSPWMITIH